VIVVSSRRQIGATATLRNHAGRSFGGGLDPLTVIQSGGQGRAFLDQGDNAQTWDGRCYSGGRDFVTAVGAGTTYPDINPRPHRQPRGARGGHDHLVTEGMVFRTAGSRWKDRHRPSLGGRTRRGAGRRERRSATFMTSDTVQDCLSLGRGSKTPDGGSKKEGRVTCDRAAAACDKP